MVMLDLATIFLRIFSLENKENGSSEHGVDLSKTHGTGISRSSAYNDEGQGEKDMEDEATKKGRRGPRAKRKARLPLPPDGRREALYSSSNSSERVCSNIAPLKLAIFLANRLNLTPSPFSGS